MSSKLTSGMKAPIGVFDSGVGGLSVLKALLKQFPHERFVYLGDTARLPYGTKSESTIVQYSLKAASFLNQQQIKSLVVACHSASSCAIPALREAFPNLMIEGMVEPAAIEASTYAKEDEGILVFGTEATIKSQCYEKTLATIKPDMPITTKATNLLVALAEEHWVEGEITEKVLQHYLNELKQSQPQLKFSCLILACTHFPILLPAFKKVMPSDLTIIDPGEVVSKKLHETLSKKHLLSDGFVEGNRLRCFVTDNQARFEKLAGYFLETPELLLNTELASLQ